jgi:hypothetical protein
MRTTVTFYGVVLRRLQQRLGLEPEKWSRRPRSLSHLQLSHLQWLWLSPDRLGAGRLGTWLIDLQQWLPEILKSVFR